MGNSLIIDNWLLQDIGASLTQGLCPDVSGELVINAAEDSHDIREIPSAGVQLEALLGLLTDVVFRDSLVLDSAFTDTWAAYDTLLSPLLDSGIVRALPLNTRDRDLMDAKRYALDRLCATSTLSAEQARNEESWAREKKAVNPYMSAVIWGTAGMLGRSHVFEAPYSGHPLRKRLMEQTILADQPRDMVAETQEWIRAERLWLFDNRTKAGAQRTAALILPPVASEIIQEARDVQQLLPVACQLRDKYAKMRGWMNTVQEAMDTEDPKEFAKYQKLLNSVSKDIDRAMGNSDAGKVSLKIGIGWPSISISLGTLDGIAKRFGMRAMLNNQIFSSHGEKAIKKLLRMFDDERSGLGAAALDYLRIERS